MIGIGRAYICRRQQQVFEIAEYSNEMIIFFLYQNSLFLYINLGFRFTHASELSVTRPGFLAK